MVKTSFLIYHQLTTFKGKFPNITELCLENDVDLKTGLIPIVPGSHFLMGGIKVDMKAETTIPGLYAIGEVACTGLHGANRLASNSLLEGLSYGKRLASHINTNQLSVPKLVNRLTVNPLKTIVKSISFPI